MSGTRLRLSVYLALMAGLVVFGICTDASHAQEVRQEFVLVTYYLPTGNPMRSGLMPFVGAAACDTSVFPMGTVLMFEDGFVVECLDTGYLHRGQVDIYAPNRAWGVANVARAYGRFAWTSVLRWGWGE